MSERRTAGLWQACINVTRRFPVAIACSLLFTAIAVYLESPAVVGRAQDNDALVSCLYILFFGCFWFISLALFSENNSRHARAGGAIAALVFLLLAYHWFDNPDISPFEHIFACLAAVLLMFVAPYVMPGSGTLPIWTFAYHLALRIAFTFLAAVLLYCGLLAILASLQFLFDVQYFDHGGVIYFRIWTVCATLFSPLFAMAGIPRSFTDIKDPYPPFLRILVCNFTIPLWALYALVVYAYGIKILLAWQLPEGGVALLMAFFGVKAIAVYLSAYPLHAGGQKVASAFVRHWPKLLAAPLALLAIAIFVRIREHGVTEDRYAIVLTFIWMLAAIFLKANQEAEAPRRIMLLAVILLLATSFGPWGVASVSTKSQVSELRAALERNGLLEHDRLVASQKPVDSADRRTISSIVEYLVDTNATSAIRPWFGPEHRSENWKTYASVNGTYKSPAQTIVEDMGLHYTTRYEKEDAARNIAYNHRADGEAVFVAGYDYTVDISNYGSMCAVGGHKIILNGQKDKPREVTTSFDAFASKLTVADKVSGQQIVFALAPLFDAKGAPPANAQPLAAEAGSGEMKGRLILKSAYGAFTSEGTPNLTSFNALLLLKLQ